MATKKKLTSHEKERRLIEKIEKSKKQLEGLKERRKIELGALVVKCGLDTIEMSKLEEVFKKLSKELVGS